MYTKKQALKPGQLVLQPTYDPRFFEDFIGRAILGEPKIAIIELIANAWDAGATKVEIRWPSVDRNQSFSIEDNGAGMTAGEFEERWMKLSYNRIKHQGIYADKPPSDTPIKDRRAFGRNGKGRHAGFCFTRQEFFVETKKANKSVTFRVFRPADQEKPFESAKVSESKTDRHGVRIYSETPIDVDVSAFDLRAEIGMRFLSIPEFEVIVDGVKVAFEHIPDNCFSTKQIYLPELGLITVLVIDTQASDRTTRHHGIAWHVSGRLVGEASWKNFDDEKFIDGRSSAAKRFSFIVQADCLDKPEYILPDWTSFNFKEENVRKAYAAANGFIRQLLLDQSSGEREKAFSSIKEKNAPLLKKMGPLNAEMWSNFVSRVQEECPSLNERELESVATILAKLEVSKSQYSLLEKVRDCSSDDFDSMDKLLESWSVQTAKIVLDELQNRLSLIAELEKRINDPKTDEVHDLQPIFDRALWIFGPEFESIEFESNKTMATVISNLLKKKKVKGSSRRPDFVALPDGSVGFYSRPSYDEAHEADKVAALVIVELKKPTVSLGRKERNQCEDYVVELRETGSITADTKVTCFLLGTTIKAFEEEEAKKGNMTLRPMLYETVIGRAKARTLFLYNRVKEAPFLNQSELANYLSPQPADMQMVMFECTTIDVTPPKP